MNLKKIIAREGSIFVSYCFIAWIISASNANFFNRLRNQYDSFIYQMIIWILSYIAIRFIIWAIRTLKKKD